MSIYLDIYIQTDTYILATPPRVILAIRRAALPPRNAQLDVAT